MADLKRTVRQPESSATKSIPQVRYSHPLTDEQKIKVDAFIDKVKREKKQ